MRGWGPITCRKEGVKCQVCVLKFCNLLRRLRSDDCRRDMGIDTSRCQSCLTDSQASEKFNRRLILHDFFNIFMLCWISGVYTIIMQSQSCTQSYWSYASHRFRYKVLAHPVSAQLISLFWKMRHLCMYIYRERVKQENDGMKFWSQEMVTNHILSYPVCTQWTIRIQLGDTKKTSPS